MTPPNKIVDKSIVISDGVMMFGSRFSGSDSHHLSTIYDKYVNIADNTDEYDYTTILNLFSNRQYNLEICTEFKNKSIENGIEYFNDLDVRSKIADCQIKFVALSNSYLLPRDPTDCYRAYCSQTEDDHDDPNIAFSNGSQIVTVTNGISNYFPKLQYRDGVVKASFNNLCTAGVFIMLFKFSTSLA